MSNARDPQRRLAARERVEREAAQRAGERSLRSSLREPEGKLLLSYLRPRARALSAMGVMGITSTALEGIRLLLLLLSLQLIVGGSGDVEGSAGVLGFGIQVPFLSELQGTRGLVIALLGLGLVTALKEGLDLGVNALSYRIQTHFMFEVRRDLLDKLLTLTPEFFTHNRAGDLNYLQNTVVGRFAVLVPTTRALLQAALDLLAALVILMMISIQLTLLLLVLAAAFAGLAGLLRARARRLSSESVLANRAAATHFLELIQGIRLVKLLGPRTDRLRKRYLQLAWRGVSTLMRQGIYEGVTSSVSRVGAAVVLMLLAVGLATLSNFVPGTDAGTALGFLAISLRAVENVRALIDSRIRLSTMTPYFLIIADLLLDRSYEEKPAGTVLPTLGPVRHGLALEDVGFAYEPDKPVLEGVSLRLPTGTMTAIVGASGSGKTTLVELLAGYRTVDTGKVVVDGRDLASHDIASYRGQVGYVTQDTVIFHDTVRENLTFLNPEASDEELENALELAVADDFLGKEGRDLDSELGERGLKISGGQRQRIALARVFLQDPNVLLLDEATNGLDLYTEARIFANLARRRQGRVMVVVAHRLSAIQRFDNIVVMQHGHVVEQGTHSELVEMRRLYFHLNALQEYAPEESLTALATL